MSEYKFNLGDFVRPKKDIVEIADKMGISYEIFRGNKERPVMEIVKRYKMNSGKITWYEVKAKGRYKNFRYIEEVLEHIKERNEI